MTQKAFVDHRGYHFGESHASYMLNSNNQYDVDVEKK